MSGRGHSHRHCVLLVDDNPRALEGLYSLFSAAGYHCAMAHSWTGALRHFKRQTFDLVVCVYRLKDRNGVGLIQEVQGKKPGLAGFVLSSFSDRKAVARDLRHTDTIGTLPRPFHDETLLEQAEAVIRRSKMRQSVQENVSDKDYILDHKVYSHSAISDLERVYPGITQGVWDEAVDKVRWRKIPPRP